jgi:hypothetical protein
MFDIVWRSVVIGTGATALMDVWALFLKAAFGLPLPNWALVGRWFCHLTGGKVFHDDIAAAEPYGNELAIGWIAHYVIGILYAGVLVVLAGPGWVAAPTFLPAWIVGLVTVGAGWFLLQPGMGAGWAASKRPNRNQIRVLNIIGHTVFALGLYGTALIIR